MKLIVLYSPAVALFVWAGLIHAFGNTDEVAIIGTIFTAMAVLAHVFIATKNHHR